MPKWTLEQMDAIYKSGTNIIVSAGAGSGKTAVLSERVLEKVKKGINIDELLILTFTASAAGEMKERIRKKLFENNLDKQLNHIDSAYITTFDAFALSIVKKYSHLLNISNNVSIIEKSVIDLKKEEIIENIFEDFYAKKDKKFLKLIDDFCTKDDKDIRNYILNINNKLDMIYDKDAYLKFYVNNFFNDKYIYKRIDDYVEILLEEIHHINNLVLELEEYVDNDYYEKVNEKMLPLIMSKNYNDIKYNINQLPNLPKGSSEEAKKIKEQISEKLKQLNELCLYNTIDEIKEAIYNTKDVTEIIIDVINKFSSELEKYKFENDLYEFVDIAKMAIKIVSEYDEVQNELKHSFKEILIDEYQDTNDLQDLFISYIQNDNVYMVGDVKQSIYRFRNANPNLFKSKYNLYSLNENGIKIDLNKNFRSREEVLNNINLIFNDIMSDRIGGADYSKSHQMIFGNQKYSVEGKTNYSNQMEIKTYDYEKGSELTKEEIEAFIIADDIKNKIANNYQVFDKEKEILRNLKYSDIAILMDRSTNFDLYKKIFEYLNVPLNICKDESITENLNLGIIKNIISLIINDAKSKDFKYSFISVARSYLFSMSDAEIFNYFVNENYDSSSIIEIINSIPNDLNLQELINYIIDKFNFYEKIINVGDIEKNIVSLDYIIDIADNFDNLGYTLEDFYNYLDNIIEKNYDIRISKKEDTEGVKIMTIHKSKGLEFSVCYYSGLYSKFNISDLKEKFIFNNEYGFIVPYFDNGIRYTIYKQLLKNKYMSDEISERIRLFYVALTRAKEKIIIVSPSFRDDEIELTDYVKMHYTSFYDILYSISGNLKKYIEPVDLNKLNLSKKYNFIKKDNYKDNIELSSEVIHVKKFSSNKEIVLEKHFSKENNKLKTKEEIETINFGKRMHSIFENFNFLNPNYDELTKFESDKVKKFISTGILDGAKKIYKEYEFIYSENNVDYHGIIDLLLEFDDEFKIIDYKLKNTDDDAYLNQLKGYKKYIELITGKKVQVYLYSIINEKLLKQEC